MNLKEALKNKEIKYIRQPHWNESSCLELPLWIDMNNCRGVWLYLIDMGNRIPMSVVEFYNDTYDQYEECESKPYTRTIQRHELFKEFDREL